MTPGCSAQPSRKCLSAYGAETQTSIFGRIDRDPRQTTKTSKTTKTGKTSISRGLQKEKCCLTCLFIQTRKADKHFPAERDLLNRFRVQRSHVSAQERIPIMTDMNANDYLNSTFIKKQDLRTSGPRRFDLKEVVKGQGCRAAWVKRRRRSCSWCSQTTPGFPCER
jgi:hypothetical protein